MKPYEQAMNSLSALDQLDQIRMCPGERRMARTYLLQAELLAEMLMRLDADLWHVFGFDRRGIGVLARHGARCKVRTALNGGRHDY